MIQWKGSNWNCSNYEDTDFCEALMDRTWGAYANVSMEGHMTETLKTYKNCNISQDLIDTFVKIV